ncbi:hypothetical protein COCNU_03G004880 [Cocos nucifera]|uniref:Uncharacterized protein n=1 Tax=Cocos nucifera TaxID=13894 RepID=A0A8K0I2L0_COCNU|nr:hypothetical protein COCNU_03G004880 [Cocos nucifera]
MYPHLLGCDPSTDFHPIFGFLLDPVDIQKAIIYCPCLLVSNIPNQLQPTLYFLQWFGFIEQHLKSPTRPPCFKRPASSSLGLSIGLVAASGG